MAKTVWEEANVEQIFALSKVFYVQLYVAYTYTCAMDEIA